MALVDQAIALHQRGNIVDAEAIYKKVLEVEPNNFDALHMLGIIHAHRGSFEAAEKLVRKALSVDQRVAPCLQNYGTICAKLNRFEDAVNSYRSAIKLVPSHAENYVDLGHALVVLKRYGEALVAYDKALALKSDLAQAWLGRGNVFSSLKLNDNSAAAYAEVLKIDPQHPFVKGSFLFQKLLSCDWKKLDELIAEIDKGVVSGKATTLPFIWQVTAKSQRSLQLCAELYNRHTYPASIKNISHKATINHKNIRIGYSSGEFRDHAVSYLIAGVLELHDKSRFEIYGIDNGRDDQSEIRRRINASVNGIIDIRKLSDTSAVAAIYESEIDILINLNGYCGEERTRVFAQRPAPIQVNYLGFPGTMGASYIDYIIADQYVIPPNHKEYYSEKVVYLPNCYQANDRKKEIGSRIFSRAECGLPKSGFVFFCFNNNYFWI